MLTLLRFAVLTLCTHKVCLCPPLKPYHQMKRSSFLTLFLIAIIFVQAKAQDLPSSLNVIPPSPSVMAMNKFVDIPVSHYTGTPNISVPIYELKMNQLSLPIGLSYHASGLRVEEQASWVGAGWALNAGGNINRTVRGLPDEFRPYAANARGRKGFFHNNKMFDSLGNIIYDTNTCDVSCGDAKCATHPKNCVSNCAAGYI